MYFGFSFVFDVILDRGRWFSGCDWFFGRRCRTTDRSSGRNRSFGGHFDVDRLLGGGNRFFNRLLGCGRHGLVVPVVDNVVEIVERFLKSINNLIDERFDFLMHGGVFHEIGGGDVLLGENGLG